MRRVGSVFVCPARSARAMQHIAGSTVGADPLDNRSAPRFRATRRIFVDVKRKRELVSFTVVTTVRPNLGEKSMQMNVPVATAGTDSYPSGSWSFGPIKVDWDVKAGDELDISVSVFGIDVDDLSGTLNSNTASISDRVNLLNIITGTLTLTAKYNQGPSADGLWISGELKGPLFDTGNLNHRIIPW